LQFIVLKMKFRSLPFIVILTATFVLILIAVLSFSEKTIVGEDLIREMHSKWKGKWYPHISFEQEAIFYKDRKVVKTEIWQEILSSPGKLHIRFNGFNSHNGAIYNNDSVYHFQSGELKAVKKETNYLALLGFDVYLYNPGVSIAKLKELGFDLNRSYRSTYLGKKIRIVGANEASDLTSSQFWVDEETCLVMRILKNTSGNVRDVHFNNYRKVENNWVATEIIFKNASDTVFVEKYFNIKFPKQVAPGIYDPLGFADVSW
jgi:hypothetical protein